MKRTGFAPFKVAIYYFIFGLIWVLFSDSLLFYNEHEKMKLFNYSITKGIIFVFISSVVIFVVTKYEMDKKIRFWEYYATHDAMTGCLNKKAGLDKLNLIIPKFRLNKRPLTIVYADLNNLKVINDKFGHDAGDRAILKVTRIIKDCIRKNDFVIRLGGDEFLIVLLDCDENKAHGVINRINAFIDILNKETQFLSISVSFGVAVYSEIYKDVIEFIKDADRKMYENKRAFHAGLKFA